MDVETWTDYGLKVTTKNKLLEGNNLVSAIGSVFVGGGTVNPFEGSSHSCQFYSEVFSSGPWNEVSPLISILGFMHYGTKYTKAGQFVDLICIGTNLVIPLSQGEYKGGCDQVKDVKINSYKFSTMNEDTGTPNDDAKIDIRILCKDGTVISILYSGVTRPHGYY